MRRIILSVLPEDQRQRFDWIDQPQADKPGLKSWLKQRIPKRAWRALQTAKLASEYGVELRIRYENQWR